MMYDKKKIELLREMYSKGTRICLDHMEDKFAVESGTCGTVQGVDDGGNILMKWDNGRSLSIIPDVDSFHVVESSLLHTKSPPMMCSMNHCRRLFCFLQFTSRPSLHLGAALLWKQ